MAILLHTVCIGLYVDSLATSTNDAPVYLLVGNQVLVVVFMIEVSMKFAADKVIFFVGKEKHWNMFDLAIIGVVLVEVTVRVILDNSIDASSKQIAKTLLKMGEVLRTFRVLRIFRVLRFSSSLRLIMGKVSNSLEPLGWVMVLIFLTIFVLAVCLTNGATQYRNGFTDEKIDGEVNPIQAGVERNFGSITQSLLTIFQATTGGMFWREIEVHLRAMGDFYFVLFITFIAGTVFAGLNIITGLFVDVVIQTNVEERDLIMEKQTKDEQTSVEHLRGVFFDMDEEENGFLTIDNFQECLFDDRVLAYMHSLKIDTSDAVQLFRLLDKDNSGEILIDEFVEGCMKLRGEARSMDVHVLMCENRRMWAKFGIFCQDLNSALSQVQTTVALGTEHAQWATLPTLPDLARCFGSRNGSLRQSQASSADLSAELKSRLDKLEIVAGGRDSVASSRQTNLDPNGLMLRSSQLSNKTRSSALSSNRSSAISSRYGRESTASAATIQHSSSAASRSNFALTSVAVPLPSTTERTSKESPHSPPHPLGVFLEGESEG